MRGRNGGRGSVWTGGLPPCEEVPSGLEATSQTAAERKGRGWLRHRRDGTCLLKTGLPQEMGADAVVGRVISRRRPFCIVRRRKGRGRNAAHNPSHPQRGCRLEHRFLAAGRRAARTMGKVAGESAAHGNTWTM